MTTLEWQVGDVKITRVVEMEMAIPYNPDAAFLKEATPERLRDDAVALPALRHRRRTT